MAAKLTDIICILTLSANGASTSGGKGKGRVDDEEDELQVGNENMNGSGSGSNHTNNNVQHQLESMDYYIGGGDIAVDLLGFDSSLNGLIAPRPDRFESTISSIIASGIGHGISRLPPFVTTATSSSTAAAAEVGGSGSGDLIVPSASTSATRTEIQAVRAPPRSLMESMGAEGEAISALLAMEQDELMDIAAEYLSGGSGGGGVAGDGGERMIKEER